MEYIIGFIVSVAVLVYLLYALLMAREVLTESKKFAAMQNKLKNIALVRRRETS